MEKLNYYRSRYEQGGGTAIYCETEEGYPFASVSINLAGYGINLPEDQIAIHHDVINTGFYDTIKEILVDKEITEVEYGFARTIIVRLKEGWKDICAIA